jgi:hypothetical protein
MPTNADEFAAATARVGKQLPFAISLAINKTAEDVQRFQVAHMHKVFTVRVPGFIGRPEAPHRSAIKRTHKASKGQPVAELAVLPPGGIGRADIIARHESDRERRPRGGGTLAVAVEARRGKMGKVPRKFGGGQGGGGIKALGLESQGTSGRVARGKERTFLIRGGNGEGAIYERTTRRRGGKRRSAGSRARSQDSLAGTRVIFSLKRRTPLKPQLNFQVNAKKTVAERLGQNFAEAVRQALETAR